MDGPAWDVRLSSIVHRAFSLCPTALPSCESTLALRPCAPYLPLPSSPPPALRARPTMLNPFNDLVTSAIQMVSYLDIRPPASGYLSSKSGQGTVEPPQWGADETGDDKADGRVAVRWTPIGWKVGAPDANWLESGRVGCAARLFREGRLCWSALYWRSVVNRWSFVERSALGRGEDRRRRKEGK